MKNVSEKTGLSPGSLIHVGDVHQPVTQISVVDYSKDHYRAYTAESLAEILECRNTESITWVTIEGLADGTIVEAIGQHFNIHPLVLEDILNTHQRPKLEEHDDYLYVVLKSLMPDAGAFSINYEQISLLVLPEFVFTFKEKTDALLAPVIKRLENSRGRFRSMGTDYLLHAILDTIVDQNFDITDLLEETLAALEEEVFAQPGAAVLEKIHGVRGEVVKMRRYISPIRDILAGLLRSESELIDETTHIYLRDVHDHVLRILESVDTHREIISSLIEIYLSSLSSKMNEVMKVLTVFASIFIPLTFIAGIYGMNFEGMPELRSAWGYPAIWVVFVVTALTFFIYFKRKGWI